MPRGGSKPGRRRGGRKPGTPNKPKGQQLIVALESAEREVRKIVLAGDKITSLGKDRLAELDDWAYGIAKKYAPKEDKEGRLYWDGEGDEVRFMRFLNFCGRCATARAQFESPKYAAIALQNQGQKTPEIYKRDPYKVMDDMVARWIAAEAAEKAERAINVTPEPAPVEVKPEPEEGVDGELE